MPKVENNFIRTIKVSVSEEAAFIQCKGLELVKIK